MKSLRDMANSFQMRVDWRAWGEMLRLVLNFDVAPRKWFPRDAHRVRQRLELFVLPTRTNRQLVPGCEPREELTLIVALRCDADGEGWRLCAKKCRGCRLGQRAGDFRGDARVVFKECDVGAQCCAAAALSHVGQKIWSELAAGDVVVFSLSQRVVECCFELFRRNFEFFRHWHGDEQG